MNMKICIVGPSKRFLSGISYYTIRLANTLSSSCDVYVLNYRKLLPEFLFPGRGHIGKNISDIELSPKVKVFDGMDYNDPATWYSAYMYLRASRPDVIILQWWTSSVSHMHLLVKMMGYLYNSKLIMEFHEVVDPLEEGILPIRLYSKFMGKLLRKNASCFITHSESDKKLIAIRYGIHPGKIHVIPHGLYDQYDILEKNIAREKFSIKEEYVILSFGLIRRYKGIKYLIKAFEQLPEDIIKRSRLLIVGEIWEDREDLLDQINSSHSNEKISLIDRYITDNEISFFFSAADVIVLPYLRASQSGIAHIAMAFGKPIIVSEVGGLKESMSRYPGAFFVPPADSDAITNEILRNFGNKKIYIAPTIGWDEISEQYLNIIREI